MMAIVWNALLHRGIYQLVLASRPGSLSKVISDNKRPDLEAKFFPTYLGAWELIFNVIANRINCKNVPYCYYYKRVLILEF